MASIETTLDEVLDVPPAQASGPARFTCGEDFDFNQEIRTQWGGTLRPGDDSWFLEELHVHFGALLPFASDSFVARVKIVLAYRSMRYAFNTIINEYNRLRNLLTFLHSRGVEKIESINEEHFVWWWGALSTVDQRHYLGGLRAMLLDSRIYLNAPLLDAAAAAYIENLTIPGNPKGVRVNDPDQGRLTLAEREIFETKSRQRYESGRLNSQELLTLVLFNSFGLRPIDYAGMKVKDFHIEYSNGEISRATVDIPVGKSGETPRSKMSIGNLLDHDVALLFRSITHGRSREEPLFDCEDSTAARQTGALAGHISPQTAALYLQRIIGVLALDFNLNAYRFRYTVGTEAFRETGNPYVAAAVLRHSDTQNVKVYANEIILAQAHDRVVAKMFMDINAIFAAAIKAKTFAGIIISEQNFKDARAIAVRAPEQTGKFKAIGGCLGELGCAQGMPVACYCCHKFRPIREADHFAMLCATLKAYFVALETDDKQATSLVSAILGMAQVCQLTHQGIARVEEAA